MCLAGQGNRLCAVGRFAEHRHVGVAVDEQAEPATQQCLVVGDHDADAHPSSSATGSRASTWNPRPFGPARNSPP